MSQCSAFDREPQERVVLRKVMPVSYPLWMSRVKATEGEAHVMSTRSAGQRFPLRVVVAGLVLWGLAACQTSPHRAETPAPAPAPAAPSAAPAGAREYQVVAEESLLQILVYRGGAMARLGHNHVIASHHLSGIGVRRRRCHCRRASTSGFR